MVPEVAGSIPVVHPCLEADLRGADPSSTPPKRSRNGLVRERRERVLTPSSNSAILYAFAADRRVSRSLRFVRKEVSPPPERGTSNEVFPGFLKIEV